MTAGDAGFEVVEAIVVVDGAARRLSGAGGAWGVKDGVEFVESIFTRRGKLVLCFVVCFFGLGEIAELVVEVVKGCLCRDGRLWLRNLGL